MMHKPLFRVFGDLQPRWPNSSTTYEQLPIITIQSYASAELARYPALAPLKEDLPKTGCRHAAVATIAVLQEELATTVRKRRKMRFVGQERCPPCVGTVQSCIIAAKGNAQRSYLGGRGGNLHASSGFSWPNQHTT